MAGLGLCYFEDIDMKTNQKKKNLWSQGAGSGKVKCAQRHTTFHYENRDFFFSYGVLAIDV